MTDDSDDSDDSGQTDFDAPWPSFHSGFYILDDLGRPMEVDEIRVWGTWFETHSRVVEQTVVGDRLFVSTVFLGLDHNFGMAGPPVLWETMLFFHNGWKPSPDYKDQEHERYRSLAAAIKGHRRWCAIARRRLQEYDASHPAKE